MHLFQGLGVFIETRKHYTEMVFDKAGEREAVAVRDMLTCNATQSAVLLDDRYMGALNTVGTAQRGLEYFSVQTQSVNAVYSLLTVLLVFVCRGACYYCCALWPLQCTTLLSRNLRMQSQSSNSENAKDRGTD